MKKFICLILVFTLSLKGPLTVMASEFTDDNISIETRIISESEYVAFIAEENNISYDEARKLIEQKRKEERINPESVVMVKKSVTKKITKDFTLECTAFLEILKDEAHRQYIEILSVTSPTVSLVGKHINASMNEVALEGKVDSKKTAKVYCNGAIQYSVSTEVSGSLDLPGYSVGVGVGGTENYVYNVSTIFPFYI